MAVSRYRTELWIPNRSIEVSEKEISGWASEHWHEFYEIELILEGSGTYTIDGIDYPVAPGTLFVMSPSSFHHIFFSAPTRLINIMFTSDVGNIDFLCGIFRKNPHVTLSLSPEDIEFFTLLARDMLQTGEIAYRSASLNCFLGKICRLYSPVISSGKDLQMQFAMLYIQNHFRENISLTDVAQATNYSVNYFSNKFKGYTGVSFKNYIIGLRLSLACKLLERTKFSVTDICTQCGFHDLSNFFACFKRQYGMPPKEYRAALPKASAPEKTSSP